MLMPFPAERYHNGNGQQADATTPFRPKLFSVILE
jgi:hypothetical protein